MKRFIAGKNEEGVRLSRFVQSVAAGLPNGALYKSFRNKRIKVNGRRAAPEDRLHEGDVLELYINDEFFTAPPPKAAPPRRRAPLRVIYEDSAIAVLYKPAHLLCHSDRTGDDSLVEAFQDYLTQKGEYDPQAEASFSPALCNRLDRGTEGLVIGAKTHPALRDMNELIRQDRVHKEYLAITFGAPPKGRHTAWLRHGEAENKAVVRSAPAPGYKEIITDVAVDQVLGPFALCRIGLVTGRTHQIRAHLAFLGAPVLGDLKYGNKKWNQRAGFKTQALCAVSLRFEEIQPESPLHGLSGKSIELEQPQILGRFAALERLPH